MLETYFSYIATGLLSGTFAGLLGVGGGIITVPLLAFIFHARGYDPGYIIHIASGTSLATITTTSLSSAYAHNRRKSVLWRVMFRTAPGLISGALAGAFLAHSIPGRYIEVLFGLFEIAVAGQIFSDRRGAEGTTRSQSSLPLFAGGAVIGAVSSMLGVGGGTLVVPFLLWFGVSIREATGTAAACGFPIALFGSVGFMISGAGLPGLPEECLGYVHIPAFICVSIAAFVSAGFGARIAYSLSVDILKNVFAILLLLLGCRMLLH